MVSSTGRGRPRPLLEGVFRKACDYCVRSKRGCNGGTPCEQCIRREQPCTYSQRRKSGPRGRPLRQQATSPLCGLGTRSSARKSKGTFSSSRDGSLGASAACAVSATSSPSRTASVSTSCSDYSSSEASDSEMEDAIVEEANQPGGKICKMAGARDVKVKVIEQVSPALPHKSSPASPSPLPSQQTLAPQQQKKQHEKPVDLVFKPATPHGKLSVWPPPSAQGSMPASITLPAPVPAPAPALQRSTSLWTWAQPLVASETSIAAQHQQHRSSASVGGVVGLGGISSGNVILHEISSQPWEISRGGDRPQPVISDTVAPPLRTTTTTVTGSSSFPASHPLAGGSMVGPSTAACGTVAQQQAGNGCTVHASQAAASFGGALLTHGGFLEDLKDFDLDCPNLEMPSLTREMSLARAVAALGGEGSVQEVGDEAPFVNDW